MRSLTDILKEADKATSSGELDSLRLEIVVNQDKYKPEELSFAKEHFVELLDKLPTYDLYLNGVHVGSIWEVPNMCKTDFEDPTRLDNAEKIIDMSHMQMDKSLKELQETLANAHPTFWERFKQAWKVLIGK